MTVQLGLLGLETAIPDDVLASQVEVVASLVRRVTVAQSQVTIEIDRKGLTERRLDQEALSTSKAENRPPIIIEVPVKFRREASKPS